MLMWLALVLLLLLLETELCVADKYDAYEEQKEYLSTYGYMPKLSRNPTIAQYYDEGQLFKKAVETFQFVSGIDITGVLDEETKESMRLPRCGNPDFVGEEAFSKKRKKRYTLSGTKWEESDVYYQFIKITPQMNESTVKSIFRRAFDLWQSHANINFYEADDNQYADIWISFVTGDHGDAKPFTGKGGALGHAFPPGDGILGDAHFDEEESWGENDENMTSLFYVALHELGHSMGVGHSVFPGAIMASKYNKSIADNATLTSDDIAAIQALYGKRLNGSDEAGKMSKPAYCHTESAEYKLCLLEKVDAIFSAEKFMILISGTDLFVIDGFFSYLTKVQKHALNSIFPEVNDSPIAFAINDKPGELVGLVRLYSNGNVWKYRYKITSRLLNMTLQNGYPKKEEEEIMNFPKGISAALTWWKTGMEYYFKEAIFYRRQSHLQNFDWDYPKDLSLWPGVPSDLDAAFSYVPPKVEHTMTYFVKGKQFFFFNEETHEVDSRFPGSFRTFLQCSEPLMSEEPITQTSASSAAGMLLHWKLAAVSLSISVALTFVP